MISRFLWRPLAGAVLMTMPALMLIPGCGGGGSGSGGSNVVRKTGVNFFDAADTTKVLTQANLSITFNRSTLTTQNVTGFIQVTGPPSGTTPTATTAANLNRQTRALPNNYVPAPATYLITGTITLPSTTADPIVSLQGAFEPQRAFTINGTFGLDQNLTLTSTRVQAGTPTTSGTLQLKVLDAPIVVTPTATPVATATPVGTPTGTTTATPSGTATATPVPTITPTAIPVGTATPTPFITFP
ncbi:hypothetical protein EON83_13775 [bacterium]|nr:MAG: hypothetical protein EON83_13775 [bacterium]